MGWPVLSGHPLRLLTSAWPWRSLAYLVSATVVGVLAMAAFFAVLFVGVLTAPLIIGVFILANLPKLGGWLAVLERRRLTLMGRSAAPAPEHWRALGYAALLSFVLWVVDLVVVALTVGQTVTLALSPVLARYGGTVDVWGWHFATWTEALPVALIGTPVAAVVSAYVLIAVATGQAALTRSLLNPRTRELEARVAELRRSRLSLVDAFETER